MGTPNDPAVLAHLEQARTIFDDTGVIHYLHDVVRTTWMANRRRYSPDRFFDDRRSLGYQTSRNVFNRIVHTISTVDAPPLVHVEIAHDVAVLAVGAHKLRVVKAPMGRGLDPHLSLDFDWSESRTRLSAAERNSRRYRPLSGQTVMPLQFADGPPALPSRQIDRCHDFFLVWAAGPTSDRTRGWLGLPADGADPWLGYVDLWLDPHDPRDRTGATEDGVEIGLDEDYDAQDDLTEDGWS